MKALPAGLVYLRAALGPVMILGAAQSWPGGVMLTLLTAGLLSDIFDGIIARRLGTATPRLRQADSAADVVFWVCVFAATEVHTSGFLHRHTWWLAGLACSETACYALSFLRFHRPPATHSYAAKLWGLLLFLGFAALLSSAPSPAFINLILGFGILVNAESCAILALAKTYPVDVKSIFSKGWVIPAKMG
jgi:CDP-diacylglycerol--glycerol-3-phosphate 3-phosphatidyltransferase